MIPRPTYPKNFRNLLVLAVLGLVFFSGPAVSSKASAGSKTVKLVWLDPAKGLKLSQATGKPILYDFTAHWCGWCKVLDSKVFEKPEYAAKIKRLYVTVVVMDESQEKGRNPDDVAELQAMYQVRGFPTLVVQYPNNGPSRELAGFAGETETMDFLAQKP